MVCGLPSGGLRPRLTSVAPLGLTEADIGNTVLNKDLTFANFAASLVAHVFAFAAMRDKTNNG